MSQKIINKVKQYTDCDDLQFGEIVVDINAKDPSVSFINEEYDEVKLRPVKDVSKEVEKLTAEMALKASAANLDATNARLTDTTNRVASLETNVGMISQTLTSTQTQVGKNADDIEALNELLTSQVTEVSKLGGIVNSIDQNSSAIEVLENNLSAIAAKVEENADDIDSLQNEIDDTEKDVNKNKADIQTVGTAVKNLQNELKNMYRIKGKSTVEGLNNIPLADRMSGDVYNIANTGLLNYGEDNKTVTIRKGDNVVWVSTGDSSGYWDAFMAPVEIPEDNYVNVISGPKSNGRAYTMSNIIDAVGSTNRVTYYLVTADGHKSMDEGDYNDRASLPSYSVQTSSQEWLNGFFLIDGDVNNRSEGSWQKAYDILKGDEYFRFCVHDESSVTKKSWTGWRRNITTDDININLLSDSFTNRTVIGALNELKNSAGGSGDGSTTVQTMGLKAMRTDDNNRIVSMVPDASNSYTIHADTDNDKCEDNLYVSVHDGTPNVLNLGVKKDAYLQKTTAELSNLFAVADHKTYSNGGKKDDNDLLDLEVTTDKQVKLSLQYTPDNPITIIDSNYSGGIDSVNWLSTDKNGAGCASYYLIMKDGIDKVGTGYPNEFRDGCLLMHFDAGDSSNISTNNRNGTFQIAVSMQINYLASGKAVLSGRKAYRMRFDDPTEDEPNNRTWSSWVYEEISDKSIDNEVNVLTQKDLNWLGSAHKSEYRNAVSYYYIAPENYENISRDGGILKKEEFSKGAWAIHYDVDGKRLGTFQQLVSIATGDVATRMITNLSSTGEGLYGEWHYSKVDLTPYQTIEITPTNIYKAGRATTVLGAFIEINKTLKAIDESVDTKLEAYQPINVDITGLTKKTVETCLAELASKVKVLEASSSSGGTATVEPYVDERVFAFKVKIGEKTWRRIPFASIYPTAEDDKRFGAAIEIHDYYNGRLCKDGQIMEGVPLDGEEPVSQIVTMDAKQLPSGTVRNSIVMEVNTENFVDEVFPYSGVNSDGWSYVNKIDDSRYGNFIDFGTNDGLLWCFDNGAYFGLGENPTDEEVAAAAVGWNLSSVNYANSRGAAIGGALATPKQAQKFFTDMGYGFKVSVESGLQYLYLTKGGISIYRIGRWLHQNENGRLGFWLDNGSISLSIVDGVLSWQVSTNPLTTIGAMSSGGAYVLVKNDFSKTLVAHNSHDSVHLNEGDKYKVENMESIIDKKISSMFDMLVPVGTIIPYLPYRENKTINTTTTFVNSSMLVENGGNWALCDGATHGGYATPNLIGMAPVGVNGYVTTPDSVATVSHNHTLYYKSTKNEERNKGSLTTNGNRKGMLYLGSSPSSYQEVMNYDDNNVSRTGSVTLTSSMSGTPGRYTWYLIRVR